MHFQITANIGKVSDVMAATKKWLKIMPVESTSHDKSKFKYHLSPGFKVHSIQEQSATNKYFLA